MFNRERYSSIIRICSPKRPPRVRYEVFQVQSSWYHVRAAGRGWVPPVDVYETETELLKSGFNSNYSRYSEEEDIAEFVEAFYSFPTSLAIKADSNKKLHEKVNVAIKYNLIKI